MARVDLRALRTELQTDKTAQIRNEEEAEVHDSMDSMYYYSTTKKKKSGNKSSQQIRLSEVVPTDHLSY